MSAPLLEAVAHSLGVDSGAIGTTQLGGGFSRTARVEVGGESYFLKWLEEQGSRVFAAEAIGLRALAAAYGAAPVVEVIAESESPPFLLLAWIDGGAASHTTMERLGREFALLHRWSSEAAEQRGAARQYGFEVDNWLGATPQRNSWHGDWVEFFRDCRLGAQLEMLRSRHPGDAGFAEFERRFEQLLSGLDHWISDLGERPSILHGDLWGGNYVVDGEGRAILIDPAAYYGHREADLAMTRLFGGFDASFYRGYEEVWPLQKGWQRRSKVYELYHLLNHWNLFGGSYRGSCERLVAELV